MTATWTLAGAAGEVIRGNCEAPPGRAFATVLLAHGFKGYKDYGMLPRLAEELARAGCFVHRFNFSHSGMTELIHTFERPDLFERDTWNRQVEDLQAIDQAIRSGRLEGGGLPLVLLGHSRGGVTCLLAVARRVNGEPLVNAAAVVTINAPANCNPFSDAEMAQLLREGALVSPSARTGQALRVGRRFLEEQLEDPAGHDLLTLVRDLDRPVLVVHGAADTTVSPTAGEAIAAAVGPRAILRRVEGADHVFNTPNPMPPEQAASPQLETLIEAVRSFLRHVCVVGAGA